MDPEHDQEIHKKTKRKRNRSDDVHGVLFEGVKETAIERERRQWGYEEVQSESEFLAACAQSRVESFNCVSRILYKTTHKDDHEVDKWEGVDKVVDGVDGADTKGAAVDVCRCDEKLAAIKLKYDNYVQKHKKHRAKYNRNKPYAERLEKIRVPFDIGYPQHVVKRSRSKVVPVGVSVGVGSPHVEDEKRQHRSVQCDYCGNRRQDGDLHGDDDDDSKIEILDFFSGDFLSNPLPATTTFLKRCPIGDCVNPLHPPSCNAVVSHYQKYHCRLLTRKEAMQVLHDNSIFIDNTHECPKCKKAFSQRLAMDYHVLRCSRKRR